MSETITMTSREQQRTQVLTRLLVGDVTVVEAAPDRHPGTNRALGEVHRRSGLVFTTSTGRPMDTSAIVRDYHAATDRLGLPRRNCHSLRHFAAMMMLEAGADLYTVSRMLGHASITTTANVYGHVTPATLRQSAELVDRKLG